LYHCTIVYSIKEKLKFELEAAPKKPPKNDGTVHNVHICNVDMKSYQKNEEQRGQVGSLPFCYLPIC